MMRKPMPQGARARLLAGCALGACLAVLPSAATAQALQGTPTTVVGSEPAFNTAPNYTQVVIRSAQTVINWEPFDNAAAGTIDFLPAGATAEFTEPSGTFDYTVLNRILPVDASGIPVSRPVAFNGTVIGLSGNNPGGNIWFYSPTGIIAGPTAVFNVGSLILTTNDISFVPNGVAPGSIYGPGGLVEFRGPADSTGFVVVQPGAQLNATGTNAYLALVAPRVVQGGQVSVNGQVAYLAAEQVDMTINAGLFDFILLVGTTDANGVVHTGTTTGPASTSAADLQRTSLVALPKNDALTMLLSGSIGYAPAASAANEGSTVVLAAGFATDGPAVVAANRLGSISIGDATFTNRLFGYATDAIDVAPGTATSFDGAATLYAVNSIDAAASAGASITAASTLTLRSGEPGTGGTINLSALSGGQVTAAGGFLLDASSGAATYDKVTPFVDAVGGIVNILADAGTISTPLTFVANVGAIAGDDPSLGGQGSGGTIDLRLDNGGVVGADSMILTALGRGGGSASTGGLGLGGTIAVLETSGQLDIGGLSLFAQGAGGDAAVRGGDGSGGFATIDLLGQAQDLDSLYVDASAEAGLPTDPAGASGHASSSPDAVRLTVAGPASLTVQFGIELGADARTGIEVVPGLGGQAGGVALEAIGGGIIDAGSIDLHANTTIRPDTPDIVPVNSPLQQGGFVNVLADTGGSIVAQTLSATATATGHEATGSAGTATGGTAQVMATGGGLITVDDGLGTALLTLVADAYGSPGPIATDAFGGTARLVVEDGSITVAGDAIVSASAGPIELSAATAGEGFDATGGSATLEMLAGTLGTGSINTANLSILANGDARLLVGAPPPGGSPIQGDGGNGTGGTAQATIAAGSLTTGRLLLESAGTGGASAATDAAIAFQSGDGQGGSSLFAQSGGTATITALDLLSSGIGGSGAPDAAASELAALAGNGTGGIAALDMIAGTLDVIDTSIEALGTGGAGMSHTGTGDATDGGFGTGGSAALRSPAGASGAFSTGTLAIRSNGAGGLGGTAASGTAGSGGSGTGFSAAAQLADGSFSLGNVIIETSGTGGNGATGGTGTGGQATFAVVDASGPSGGRALNNLTVEASGNAGLAGGTFPGQSDAGDVLLDMRVLGAASAVVVNGSVALNSFGGVIGAPSGVTVNIAGAPLNIGGNLTVEAGDIAITAGEPLLAAADAFLSAERTFVSTGLVGTDGALTVQANLGVTAARLSSGGATLLRATLGDVEVGDLLSTGAVTARGRSVAIASTGGLDFAEATATAGDVTILTDDFLNTQTVTATGLADLRTDGTLHAAGDVTAAAIDLRANGDIMADAGLLAPGNLSATARGTFTLAGSARGTSIDVASGNIALGTGASLGSRGLTSDLTLTNLNVAAVMNIGGEAQAGYSLDQAEAARLFADDSITFGIAALPLEPGYGRIAVGDLALTFGATGNIGTGGQLEISTPAEISITGDVALTTSGADDTFLIDPTLVEIDTSTGSIALLGATGNPLGRLELVGDTTAIASTSALTQLRTLTDMAAINALLDTPGGTGTPLRAGTIAVSADDALFIQNSGASSAFADRRGFAAGALEITTASPSTRIAINGQILTAAGPVSGLETAPLLRINGAAPAAGGQFDAASTINGCVIGGNCALPPEPEFFPPTSEDIESPVPEQGEGSLFVAPLIELADTEPLITPPLVDEPITGVGNDDLWEPRCEPGEEGGTCPEDDGQP